MRDPARIDRICDLLRFLWHQVPDWRLGQLVCNIGRQLDVHDPFFIEDDRMEEFLTGAVMAGKEQYEER